MPTRPPPGPIEVSTDLVRAALEGRYAEEHDYAGIPYIRFRDGFQKVPRGTVVIDGHVLPCFPSIGRIYVLEPGLRRAFPGPFYAEEKIDGYNVRVICVQGKVLPFTRGGFVCPFTEDRIGDWYDFGPFFEAHPDWVLCGEVAGPGNPYIDTAPPQAPSDDSAFFGFDTMRLDHHGMLPVTERDQVFARFSVPHARILGRYTLEDLDTIREHLQRLDRTTAEGIVFKPEGDGLRVKYTTPSINLYDVTVDAPLLAELPGEFFVQRIIRLVLAYEDMGKQQELAPMSQELGRTLATDFLATLRQVRAGEAVHKRFVIRVHSDEAADRVMRHINRVSKKIQVNEVSRTRDGQFVVLTMEKVFQQSTSWLRSLLDGQHIIE